MPAEIRSQDLELIPLIAYVIWFRDLPSPCLGFFISTFLPPSSDPSWPNLRSIQLVRQKYSWLASQAPHYNTEHRRKALGIEDDSLLIGIILF